MANDEIKNHSDEQEKSFSRRNFLKMSGAATGSLVVGTYLGSLIGTDETADQTAEDTAGYEASDEGTAEAAEDHTRALKFFRLQDQFDTIQAASERIFPSDDNGPGAAELGVATFIDHELAGGYGLNDKEYRQGPFKPDSATPYQGPQYPMNRREVFNQGIIALDREAQDNHDVDYFHELEDDQQDEILQAMQDGDVDMIGVPSSYFFEQLRLATISGTYADPLYRGNRDMAAWDMKGFPGAQMSYINEIEEEGFTEIEPQSNASHLNQEH